MLGPDLNSTGSPERGNDFDQVTVAELKWNPGLLTRVPYPLDYTNSPKVCRNLECVVKAIYEVEQKLSHAC